MTPAVTITTPALLFPAISLLLLAYTNRYVAVTNRIRMLHALYKEDKSSSIIEQIRILKRRIKLIRDMQLNGILSILFAALTMFLIFIGQDGFSVYSFATSIILLMTSLSMAAIEIILSNRALDIQLNDIEEELRIKH
jgi:hypothetical protein